MMNQTKATGEDHQEEDVTRNYGSAMIPLGQDFQPGEDDVLVGRGKLCRNWQGNARFRDLVASKLDDYSAAASKLEKSAIVTSILYQIRTKSPKGGFIKKDPLTGQWFEVGDFVARERVTQCFRDALHGKYRSSNTSKKQRRKEELRRAKEQSPAKKAKKAPPEQNSSSSSSGILRITDAQQPSIQPQTTGLQDMMMLPTGLPSSSSLLPNPVESRAASLFDQTLRSRSSNPKTGGGVFSAESVSSSLMPPLTGRQSQQLSNSDMPPLLASAGQGLEHQILELQRLNQLLPAAATTPQLPIRREEKEEQIQDSGYPGRWFRVNSGESLLHSSLMNDASLSNAPSLLGAAATTGTIPSSAALPNESFARFNQLLNEGQVRTGRTSSSSGMAASAPPVPSLDFTAYEVGDDNPFEPVPIAENISRRNSENKCKPK